MVPFVQFKKRKKHAWRSVNFSKVADYGTTVKQLNILVKMNGKFFRQNLRIWNSKVCDVPSKNFPKTKTHLKFFIEFPKHFSEKFLEIFSQQKLNHVRPYMINQITKTCKADITVKVLSFTSGQPLLRYYSQVKQGPSSVFSNVFLSNSTTIFVL